MRLAIVGASGHGKVVAETAELVGWKQLTFFDDAWPTLPSGFQWRVEGGTNELLQRSHEFASVVIAIGDNQIRSEKQRELSSLGFSFASLVHPHATVSPSAHIGAGTVIFARAVVNACADVGEGCIINTGAIVEHDCSVDSFTHISPNAVLAGGVRVGEGSWIGASASVKQRISIGANSIVGMGGVVLRDVMDNSAVAGNPARVIES